MVEDLQDDEDLGTTFDDRDRTMANDDAQPPQLSDWVADPSVAVPSDRVLLDFDEDGVDALKTVWTSGRSEDAMLTVNTSKNPFEASNAPAPHQVFL